MLGNDNSQHFKKRSNPASTTKSIDNLKHFKFQPKLTTTSSNSNDLCIKFTSFQICLEFTLELHFGDGKMAYQEEIKMNMSTKGQEFWIELMGRFQKAFARNQSGFVAMMQKKVV